MGGPYRRGGGGTSDHGLTDQRAYWETAGATKTFTHPIDLEWLAGIARDARILDYGCVYGRLMATLAEHGFPRLKGADISAALIARGRRTHPDLDFEVIESPPALSGEADSFDVVLLFAVLTCVPDDEAQRDLIAEIQRVLAPGGLLYVSDLLTDERNRSRYAADGTFVTSDGATCRHHTIEHLRRLLSDFDLVAERRLEVSTMNGNPAAAAQLLVREPVDRRSRSRP